VQDMTEMRFVPDDKGMLDAMFHAMSECQSLHPDSQDSFSEGLYLFAHVPLTVFKISSRMM
jgi:nucleotide-sensitive chloride channel 1A